MRRIKEFWNYYAGLITMADVLGVIGFWLYKGTVRRTAGVGMMLLILMIVGRKIDTLGVSWESAVTGTAGILVGSCVGGLLLMSLSGSFSRSVLTLAEAKGANLLENMKKSRMALHCQLLWQRVFRYEQTYCSYEGQRTEKRSVEELTDQVRDLATPAEGNKLETSQRLAIEHRVGELGRTELGWKLLFDYAVQVPLPRSVLRYNLRYDMSLVVDWYDGAPFHHTDNKLFEQYLGAEHLQEAKAQVHMGLWYTLDHRRRRFVQSIWFKMIIRAIQLRVSRACAKLDRRYPTFHFAPDLFLWPCEENYDVVRRQLGQEVADDLIEVRKKIMHRVLHPQMDYARKLLHRAIYPGFAAATRLRRYFDPQYVLGELDEKWESDLLYYDRALAEESGRLGAQPNAFVDRSRRIHDALEQYLAQHVDLEFDGHPVSENPEVLRAFAIAAHVNLNGLSDLLMEQANAAESKSDGAGHSGKIQGILSDVFKQLNLFTRRLLAVRTHHELTRIELEDYEEYLHRILH